MPIKSRKKSITMGDVARLARVSKPTVSRALRDSPLVTPETRARVLEVVREHGYAVNRNAQKLRHLKTDTVAVMLDFPSHRRQRIADPFIYELLAGVSEALSLHNQELILSPPGLSDAESYRRMLTAKGADGFILLGQGLRKGLFKELAESEIPLVVWGAVTADAPFCTVGSDNRLGGMLAGRRFIELGRTRVLFAGDRRHQEIALRRRGLKGALDQAPYEIEIDDLEIDDFSYNASYQAGVDYLRVHEPPDAVFAYSDTAAMALIGAFREADLNCPGDFSMVGYNGIPASAHFIPPITTIQQDTYLAGSILVEKLMQIVDGQSVDSLMLPTEIIVRAT